jgi:hypothetical protein
LPSFSPSPQLIFIIQGKDSTKWLYISC